MLKIKAIKGRVIIFKNRKLTLDGDIGNEYEISKEEFQKDKEMQSVMKYLIINNINSNVGKKDTKESIIAHDIKQESIKNVVIKQPEIDNIEKDTENVKENLIDEKDKVELVNENIEKDVEHKDAKENLADENDKVESVNESIKSETVKQTKSNNSSRSTSKAKKSNKINK